MVAKCLDDKKGSFGNVDGNGNENGKKSNKFILDQNNNFAHASRFSAHFFAILARMRHETS